MRTSVIDVITEIIQGIIAVTLVGVLGAVAIIDVMRNQPFQEPAIIASLAGAAVGFYYGQRNQRRAIDTLHDIAQRTMDNSHDTGGGKGNV